MAITITWLTTDFKMKEVVLSFRELADQHSGKNIAEAFFSVLEEFQITNKVSTISSVLFFNTIKVPNPNFSSETTRNIA